MTVKNVFLVILGVILLTSALIAIAGLITETSEHVIPREHICAVSPFHHENFDGMWDNIVRRTGIDTRTAALTRITLDINPDDSVEQMDLQFIAEKNGAEGFYSVWYRRDSPECGWIDGLIYPGIFPEGAPANTLNPRSIFGEIRGIPLSTMNLSGKKIRILGDCTRSQQEYVPDPALDRVLYLWKNRSLVPLLRVPPGFEEGALFSLDFSQMNCTLLREGLINCHDERSVRVFSTIPRGTCRPIPGIHS